MATSGRRAQEAIRAHGSKKCSKHYGKEVIYFCENCEELTCADCVIKQHKGHELEGLSDVIPGAKQKLQDFVYRAEGTEIPQIREKIKKLDDDLSKNKREIQKQVSQIKQRNEIMKKELDKITETMVKTCHDMENQNSDTLLNHQKELQTQLDKLSSKIKEVKATLQSGNDILVYDTSRVIPSEFDDLPTPSCSTAEFSPGKLPLQELERLLGKLNITDHYQPSLSLSQPANWRVMSEFMPCEGCYVNSMHAAGDTTWLSFVNKGLIDNKMLSVNQKGQVQQQLDTDSFVTDFCISPKTGNIWYCTGRDNSVREVTSSREQVKFKEDTEILSICVTTDDHLLVGRKHQIVKYTQTGQTICTTSGGTTPVVRGPWRMSECPLTRHIAVADSDWMSFGGNGKPHVSILNDQLQLLHTYSGELSGQLPPQKTFSPLSVCYTDTGELVIVDQDNMAVVLVTGKGKYSHTVYTDNESETSVVSYHSGALWVSLKNGEVKVLKNN